MDKNKEYGAAGRSCWFFSLLYGLWYLFKCDGGIGEMLFVFAIRMFGFLAISAIGSVAINVFWLRIENTINKVTKNNVISRLITSLLIAPVIAGILVAIFTYL